jgi:hypothetical protein
MVPRPSSAPPRLAGLVGALVLAAALGGPAVAEPMPDYFARGAAARAVPRERTQHQWVIVGGLAGGALVLGGIGAYFNLDSRDAANRVSASLPTGEPWDASHQAIADQATSSGHTAIFCYGVGGALLVGAFVAFLTTGTTTTEPTVRAATRAPLLVPTAGGAVVGGTWSF